MRALPITLLALSSLAFGGTVITPPASSGGGSGGTPGGSSGQVQYNNSSAFGGVTGLTLSSGTLSSFSLLGDTTGQRDAAGTFRISGASGSPGALRVTGTYTDASNYLLGKLSADASSVTLSAETAGTGADNVDLILRGAGTGAIKLTGSAASGSAYLLRAYDQDDTLRGYLRLTDYGATSVAVFDKFLAASVIQLDSTGAAISIYAGLNFTDGAYYGTVDAAIKRNAAGVLKITDGSTGSGDIVLARLLTSGTSPALGIGAGAGTGGTATLSADSTDEQGVLTINAGTLPSVGAVAVTGTFTRAYSKAPTVVMWPHNATSAALGFLPFTASTPTTFTVNTAAALSFGGSTTYEYNYLIKAKQ